VDDLKNLLFLFLFFSGGWGWQMGGKKVGVKSSDLLNSYRAYILVADNQSSVF
jgi:hypothetical protein